MANKAVAYGTAYIELGLSKGYIREVGGQFLYLNRGKKYNAEDPEERVRAAFYVELIEKYEYPPERIDLEVEVPRRTPADSADIVVYSDDDLKSPFIVTECKREGLAPCEIAQAVEQAFGNANSLRSKYATVVAGSTRVAFDVSGFKPGEREKNVIGDLPVHYGKPRQFRFIKGDPTWDLIRADINELRQKFQQCHDIIWEGGKRNPAEAFDEMSKLMFCKMQDERVTEIGKAYRFQVRTHETPLELTRRVREIYDESREKEPNVFQDAIRLSNEIVYNVVERIQAVSLAESDLDAKGRAFEQFMGKIFRGEMGQFFTPREIVEFMVRMLCPTHKEYVTDPACGSGGFLLHSMKYVREELFRTHREKEAERLSWTFSHDHIFGIEVSDQIARVAMMDMVLHDDGHSNIKCADALDDYSAIDPRGDIRKGRFDILFTNPPFGAKVLASVKRYLNAYELGTKVKKRKSQSTEILFLERCLDLLTEGGRMAIVLPEAVLTNSSLQYVRDFVMDHARILAVVSLPNTAFTQFGAGVKASLLFLTKRVSAKKVSNDYPIFMAIAGHIGYDATGRPDDNELFTEVLKANNGRDAAEHGQKQPGVLKVWLDFIRSTPASRVLSEAPLAFQVKRSELQGRLDCQFYHPDFIALENELRASPFEVLPLGDKKLVAKIVDGPFGSQLKVEEYQSSGIPLVRVGDLANGEVEESNLVYISPGKQAQLIRSQVLPGDVLLTKAGSLGYAAVFPSKFNEGNITSHLAAIRCKENLLPEYLALYLRSPLGKRQLYRWGNKTTRPELNTDEVRKILVVKPPLEIQRSVVAAYRAKAFQAQHAIEKARFNIAQSEEEAVNNMLGKKP